MLGATLKVNAQLAHHHHHDAEQGVHDHEHEDIRDLLNMHDQQIHFIENKGQFGKDVLFRADFPLGQAVATREGMVVTAFDPAEVEKRVDEGFRLEADIQRGLPYRELTWQRKGHAWQLHFQGASSKMHVESHEDHGEASHYFLGDDPSGHATDVRSFQEVWYRDVYENIDVRYYPAEDGSLEYDIICMPGGDASRIAIEFRGIDRLSVNEKGELVMNTSLGEMSYPAPYVYQRINGREREIASRFVTDGSNVLRFELGDHDRSEPLVIDPIAMRWATWVNTNSSGDNHGHCIWVDPSDGAIYVVARVVGTTDQITPGAFNVTANGNLDIIIGKYLEPANIGESGTRVWQTYLGGSGNDNPYAMEQGPDGNLYITGNTTSTNYPMLGGPLFSGSSINQQAQSGADIFLTKIDRDGTSIKSAVVGGNGDDLSFDLRIGANGDVVICGYTTSSNLASVNPGVGATNSNFGNRDVIVYKINSDLNTLGWMRNYGGSGLDQAMIMLQAENGDIFIGGYTASTNFPLANERQSTRGGSQAGFLQRLNASGTTLWSSYFSSASSSSVSILCMEFNTTQTELYFGGITTGLPSSNISASGVFNNTHNGSNDFFVCRMATDQTFIASTYVGGSGNEVNMMGLNVDLNNDIYVFGYSNSSNFPVSAAPNVPLQATKVGTGSNNDKVFFKLESDLSALEFSTYYGGSADDYDPVGERGIKFSNCRIYTIVTARSNNIPLTQGALNTTKNSSTTRYEPGLVIWANPPDLLDNTIIGNQSVCEGAVPSDIVGSVPSYVLPTIVRNNSASAYPSLGNAATYQWQTSADSVNWVDIPGADGQNLPGSFIGPVDEKTYVRRIIGGDACILAGAADQVVTVKLVTISGEVTNVSCNGAADGSITATSDGTGPFEYEWDHGPTTATVDNLPPGSYTVTVTDINGCSTEGTFEITQPEPLTANAQVVDATCNTSNGSATVSPLGGTPGYGYLWNTGAVGATLNGVPGGTYDVTVTDANDCTFNLPVQIGSTGVPDITAGPAGTITCANNGEVTLAGASSTPAAQFAWVASNGGNIVAGANTATPTVNAAGTYTLTVTAPNQCFATEQTTVSANTTAPGASASVDAVLTCTLLNVTLEGGSPTQGATFAWTGPNGYSSPEQSPSVATSGLYELIVTDPANECTSEASVTVDQDNDVPGASATGGTLTCTTPCFMLQGNGGGSFAWSGPGGFTSNEQNPEVCVPGTYNLIVTGANGCTSTASTEVDEDNDLPGASATGGTLTCTTPCIMLQGNGSGSFAWSGPGGFNSTEQNPEVCAPGTYNLIVTGANGCTSTASTEVDEDNDLPGASATGGTLTCTTPCVTLQGNGGGSFAWSGPGGFTSNEQNPEVCVPGTYNLIVTGANGCTSTASTEVDEDNDLPGATAIGGTLDCISGSLLLSATGNGTFAWEGPGGFISNDPNPSVNMAGTYVLVVTGNNGCTSTDVAIVEECDDVKDCPPIISYCPADITLNCVDDLESLETTGMIYFRKKKDCPEVIEHGWSDEILSSCPYVIRRTFFGTDATGETETCEQIITVIDDVPPVLMDVPADLTLSCDEVSDDMQVADVTAYDACSKTNVTVNLNSWTVPGSCANEYTIVHAWATMDACGNVATAHQQIHVVDDEGPVFDCVLHNMTVDCNGIPEPVDCVASDNCPGDVVVTMEETKTGAGCKSEYTITRTYTAVDACGNTSTTQQVIHVAPTNSAPATVLGDDRPVRGTALRSANAWPNPFRGESMIRFIAAEEGHATVEVLDMQGRMIATLFSASVTEHQEVMALFNPGENSGSMFIYRIVLNGEELRGKLLHQP